MRWKNILVWKIEFSETSVKQLKKLDTEQQLKIKKYLKDRILTAKHPKVFGKGLMGNKAGLWRYRIGDYRLICRIEESVLVLVIGHRKKIYNHR